MAFELEGFCVVRGPDVLWGGDIRNFHPPAGRFEGVIGGPPCQAFSDLASLQRARGIEPKFGNLVPEFQRVVYEARPGWFVMEQVPKAPVPRPSHYAVDEQLYNNRWLGEQQERTRRISFGIIDFGAGGKRLPLEQVALLNPVYAGAVTSSDGGRGVRMQRYTLAEMLEHQGLPADFFVYSPLTVEGKKQAIANGVPLPMGRAIARAVRAAMYPKQAAA